MRRVLLFLDYYGNGGIENVINKIRNNLNDKYKIDILSFVNCSGDNSIYSLLNTDNRNFAFRNLIGLFKLRHYLKNTRYDIIHINCYNAFGLIYAYIFKKYAKKIIVHSHNCGFDRDFFKVKKFINYILKKICKKNYILIGCSKETNLFCFGNEYIVVSNGTNYDDYYFNSNNRKKFRNEFNLNDKIIIGCIGRFTMQKNHLFIIKVFYKLLKENDKYFLVLIGEGKYLKFIKSLVKVLNIDENILFFRKRNDISKIINMFDIYIQPSLYEGFGLSILENQINNRLVFISDRISENIVVSNNTYRIPLNVNAWVNKILNTKRKKLSLDSKFEIDIFISSINDLYKK